MVFIFYFTNLTQGKAGEGSGIKVHEDDYICHNFSEVKEGVFSFTSPNYPNHYPSDTVCTRHIVAPEGKIIQLDFREQFHIEESDNCEYDYLSVHDGQHGYAKSLGRFCGHTFPSMLYSKGNHLWLEFSSDASIQCAGFKAVYKFLTATDPPGTKECFKEVGGIEGVVDSTDIDLDLLNKTVVSNGILDCVWRIRVHPELEISIKIDKFSLLKPNECDINLFEIYNRTLSERGKLGRYCGTKADAKTISGNEANIRLRIRPSSFWTSEMNNKKLQLFSLVFTAQRKIEEGNDCRDNELNCGDGYCIDKSLRCNSIENCKYKYDEENCDVAASLGDMLQSQEMITILIVFTAMVLGMCASLSVSCYTKIKKRQAKEREYRQRRSKETSVEYSIDPEGDKGQDPEIGSKRKAAKWLEDVDEDNGCYVPEVDLSVFRKQPNGGEVIPRVQETSIEPNAHPMPNTIPIKPKRPLQSPPSYSEIGSSPRSSPPPPLPPHRGRDRIIPPIAEGTFQPPRAAKPPPPVRHGPTSPMSLGAAAVASADDDDEEEVDPPHQIRAQAVIEAGEDGSRARSFESTKSAPDVIVNR